MSKVVEKIKTIPKLYHASGCMMEQIDEAKDVLGLQFPEEFIDYVREYGAISFFGTEWTGLNVTGYLNVVETTKNERIADPGFPKDCFVLENLGIDGLLAIVDEQGRVFSFWQGNQKAWCESLSDYLDICLARKK